MYLTATLLFLLPWASCEMLELPDSINSFSAYLYQAVRDEPGNLVMSPFSVATVLTMTWLGAGSYSAHEILRVLHLEHSRLSVEQSFSHFLSSLKGSEQGLVLDVANKIFIQDQFPINRHFEHSIETVFHTSTQHIDFQHNPETARTTINSWVERATHDMIKDLIQPGDLDSDTKLVLMNAMYFKGRWMNPFVESENTKEPFFLPGGSFVEVPMMYQASKFRIHTFKELNGLKVLRLPYLNERLSMLILLPRSKNGLDCLEAMLPLLNITHIMSKLKPRQVEVTIPKFKVVTKLEMKEPLMKMGIQEIFGDNANLTGITNLPIKVDDVVQKTLLEVNEEGTEAAVVTEMKIVARMGRMYTPFKANHPFMFLVCDERSKTILFIGRFVRPETNPQKKETD